MKRGFTVVEVVVTMVVITIILGLGTVGLRSSLANGRDAERQADIETIARGLEQRFDRTYSYNWMEDTNSDGTPDTVRTTTWPAGTYPGHAELWDTIGWYQRVSIGDVLPGVTKEAVKTPSGNGMGALCYFWFWDLPRCDKAEKPSNIQGEFNNGSGGWKDIYLYEFVHKNGGYCNWNDCARYNLYWLSETKTTNVPEMGIPGLQVWRSKRQ